MATDIGRTRRAYRSAAFRLIGASGERSDLAAGTRCDLFLLSGRRRGLFDGSGVLFRNLEPSGLLLANVWALPVLIEATLLRLEDWSLLCR